MKRSMQQRLQSSLPLLVFWLPFAFSAVVCILLPAWNGSAAMGPSYYFLPMAFFFASANTLVLAARIRKLEARLQE